MFKYNRVTLIAVVKSELHRLNLDLPELIGHFDLEKIAQTTCSILTTEHKVPVERIENSTEEAGKAVFRAISSEIYLELRQTQNPLLTAWLRTYLLAGLRKVYTNAANFEDAVQVGLQSIFARLDSVTHPESFLNWALQIVRNAHLNHFRKTVRNVKIQERLARESNLEVPDSVQAFFDRELREIFLHHINNLRPTRNTKTQQFILLHFYFRGWSIEEIAWELKITNQRVSHLLDEAHNRLRNDAQLINKLLDWKNEDTG